MIAYAWKSFFLGDPLYVFSKKLNYVKQVLKFYKWEPESLEAQISRLKLDQQKLLSLMETNPNNTTLKEDFIEANSQYEVASREYIWLKQCASLLAFPRGR